MTGASGSGRGTPLAASLRRWSGSAAKSEDATAAASRRPLRSTSVDCVPSKNTAVAPSPPSKRASQGGRSALDCAGGGTGGEGAGGGTASSCARFPPTGGGTGGRGAAGGGTGADGGAAAVGRSASWSSWGRGVPRGLVMGSSGAGVRIGAGGLSGGRFNRGAGLDRSSSSSRLISVGSGGARGASTGATGMTLLSRLGGGGGAWGEKLRAGSGPESSSAPCKAGGLGGGGGGGGRRGRAELSEPASGAEGTYAGGVPPSGDSAARIPPVTRMIKSPTKTLSLAPSDVASAILRPFT